MAFLFNLYCVIVLHLCAEKTAACTAAIFAACTAVFIAVITAALNAIFSRRIKRATS